MIDFSRIKDPIYFSELVSDINSTSNIRILEDLIKRISRGLYDETIDIDDARKLVDVIKKRIIDVNGYKRSQNSRGSVGKSFTMTPTNSHRHTYVSDNRGIASIVFIIVNIAITTVMYTLLLIARFIK